VVSVAGQEDVVAYELAALKSDQGVPSSGGLLSSAPLGAPSILPFRP